MCHCRQIRKNLRDNPLHIKFGFKIYFKTSYCCVCFALLAMTDFCDFCMACKFGGFFCKFTHPRKPLRKGGGFFLSKF